MSSGAPGTGCGRYLEPAGMRTPVGNRKFIPRHLRFCRASEFTNDQASRFADACHSSNLVRNQDKPYTAYDMPKPKHREEIEIKLRVPDVAALRSRLKRLRAREITPRTHESNTLYDTPRHDLRRRGQLIRIRIEQPASSLGKRRPKRRRPSRPDLQRPSTHIAQR